MNAYDLIIIGSGAAGLCAALHASRVSDARILLVTKESLRESNTSRAQGGIAVSLRAADAPEKHAQDTLAAGDGLCHPEAVEVLVREGPQRVRELMQLGMPFDRAGLGHGDEVERQAGAGTEGADTGDDGPGDAPDAGDDLELALTREGGHREPRILHAGGDRTGFFLAQTLIHTVLHHPQVDVAENAFAVDLLMNDGGCAGLLCWDQAAAEPATYGGGAVILATGGCGQLYPVTTNPPVATGDGLAMAFRAGAELADMAFIQFHPTVLVRGGQTGFLISEAVRGEGGRLYNRRGERFMPRYDERAELAPRDVVARAIYQELDADGCVYLDITHRGEAWLRDRFPTIFSTCLEAGLDMSRERIPVAPAAHYIMGGIAVDIDGYTGVPGLFACGEVVNNGVHGANRLASNSLLETLVFPPRAAAAAVAHARRGGMYRLPQAELPQPPGPPDLASLKRAMAASAGIVRGGPSLAAGAVRVEGWLEGARTQFSPQTMAWGNLLTVAASLLKVGQLREESRGAHYRSDFPEPDPAWRCRILHRRDGRVRIVPWNGPMFASSG